MSEEHEYEQYAKRMETRFPKMYSGKYGGFAIGKGWYPLIEKLSEVIQSHIDHLHKQGKECPQVIVEQVKEKFGTLRFYYTGGDEYIAGLVSMAESMSGVTCEGCGNPGERRGGGWVHTYCKTCEEAREQRKLLKEGFEE